jgi:hypothetical protein
MEEAVLFLCRNGKPLCEWKNEERKKINKEPKKKMK